VGLLVLATVAGLVLSAHNFEAASPGVVADYWEYLCGVQVPGFTGHSTYARSGGVYPETDGLLYYYEQHHHEQVLFVVSPEEVLAVLPLAQEHLESERLPDDGVCTATFSRHCEAYKAAAPRRAVCRANLIEPEPAQVAPPDLERIRVRVSDDSNPEYRQEIDAAFRERVVRAERVWLSFAFEAAYLGAWLLFVAWPLFASSRIRWYWRAGLAPFLLFLPNFLGYAPMTFTFGPSGGFVYPGYLLLASLPLKLVPCSAADQYLWEVLPPVLAPLSQVPGNPSAYSYMTCVGPASSLFFGVASVVLVSLVALGWFKIKRCRAVS